MLSEEITDSQGDEQLSKPRLILSENRLQLKIDEHSPRPLSFMSASTQR